MLCVGLYAYTCGVYLYRDWHLRGCSQEKPRTIEDYIAVVEILATSLIVQISSRRHTAKGVSKGGGVAGLAVNRRSTKSFQLTEHEFDKYRNPIDDALAAKMFALYCPILNVSCNDGTLSIHSTSQ